MKALSIIAVLGLLLALLWLLRWLRARTKQPRGWPAEALFSGEPSLADVWAKRGVSFRPEAQREGKLYRIADDDGGGGFTLDPASGRVTHVGASGAAGERWRDAQAWFCSLVDAQAAETWGPIWRDLLDPAIQVDPAELERVVEAARALFPDLEPLPAETAANPERAIGWLFGEDLPAPGIGDFLEHCEAHHEVDGATVQQELLENLSPEEQLEAWVLVRTDEDAQSKGFWYWDRSRRDFARVLVLAYDDHWQHVDHEFASVGEVLASVLRERLQAFLGQYDLVTVGVMAGYETARSFPWHPTTRDPRASLASPSRWSGQLSPSAQALLDALPLFFPAVPIDVVAEVTGISPLDLRHAVAELDALGLTWRRQLRGLDDLVSWSIETLIVADAVLSSGLEPRAEAKARWEATRSRLPEVDEIRRVRREAPRERRWW